MRKGLIKILQIYSDVIGTNAYNETTKVNNIQGGSSFQSNNMFKSYKALREARKSKKLKREIIIYCSECALNDFENGATTENEPYGTTLYELENTAMQFLKDQGKPLTLNNINTIVDNAMVQCDWQDIVGYIENEMDVEDLEFDSLKGKKNDAYFGTDIVFNDGTGSNTFNRYKNTNIIETGSSMSSPSMYQSFQAQKFAEKNRAKYADKLVIYQSEYGTRSTLKTLEDSAKNRLREDDQKLTQSNIDYLVGIALELCDWQSPEAFIEDELTYDQDSMD